MRALRTSSVLGSLVLAISSATPNARAGDDAALAAQLFDAGVKKMEQGKCDEAPVADAAVCLEARDAFRRAFALYPAGLGALRNLAYVEKSLGLVGSSARHFRELARRAPSDPNPARQLWAEFAREEIEALEPRIPKLAITLPSPLPEGTKVTLDEDALPKPAWGTAIEVDPGEHTVRVEAEGRAPFTTTVTLAEGESKEVVATLPVLQSQSKDPKSVTAPKPAPEGSWLESRTVPLVVAGVGGAAVVVGLGLGWAAIDKRDEVCGTRFCEPQGYEEGRSLARASTIVTGLGLATAAGGLAWWWFSGQSSARPSDAGTSVTPYANAHGGGFALTGSF